MPIANQHVSRVNVAMRDSRRLQRLENVETFADKSGEGFRGCGNFRNDLRQFTAGDPFKHGNGPAILLPCFDHAGKMRAFKSAEQFGIAPGQIARGLFENSASLCIFINQAVIWDARVLNQNPRREQSRGMTQLRQSPHGFGLDDDRRNSPEQRFIKMHRQIPGTPIFKTLQLQKNIQ